MLDYDCIYTREMCGGGGWYADLFQGSALNSPHCIIPDFTYIKTFTLGTWIKLSNFTSNVRNLKRKTIKQFPNQRCSIVQCAYNMLSVLTLSITLLITLSIQTTQAQFHSQLELDITNLCITCLNISSGSNHSVLRHYIHTSSYWNIWCPITHKILHFPDAEN